MAASMATWDKSKRAVSSFMVACGYMRMRRSNAVDALKAVVLLKYTIGNVYVEDAGKVEAEEEKSLTSLTIK